MDVLPSRWPVFLSLFLQKTVLSSWLVPGLIFMNWPRTYGFIPGLSLLSWSPCVCVPASSSLWWLLQVPDVVWSWRARCLQLCSSFSESSWPFKVLFNISSLLLGVFLFLWKRPLNIILWLQSVGLITPSPTTNAISLSSFSASAQIMPSSNIHHTI